MDWIQMQGSRTRARRGLVGVACFALVCVAGDARADDWPQWRGPQRDGISAESAWTSEGRAESAWEMEVGLGYSAVAVADGKLFTMGFDPGEGLDVVYCLDAASGDVLWTHTYPAKIWNLYHTGGTLTTPTVVGDRVYTLNREGRLFCLVAETGDPIWEKALMEEHEELESPTWGYSASPLILDDTIYVNVGRVLALDRKSGRLLWKSDDYGHAYGTPLALEVGGVPSLAVFNGKGLVILSREDGSAHGMHEWKTEYDVNAATPVLVGEDQIFISSGYNKGCALLRVGKDGLEVVWETKTMRNKMSGSVLWEDHLYGFDETDLTCMDLDGKKVWNVRDYDNGALTVADGRLLIVNSEGELIVAKASPEGYEELSKAKVFEDREKTVFWTTPVLADGRVYCRSSQGALVCRDHRDGSE